MDSSVEPEIRIAALEATIERLRHENAELRRDKTVLEGLATIDGARMKRMERELMEATKGIAARATGPGSTRAVDRK